jgi:hypothetical protein
MTIKIADLDLNMLNFSEVKLGKATPFIKPIYGVNDLPYLQLPWLNLSTFGVPPKSEYTKEDKQRMFIKVPIEEDSDLYQQLLRIDDKMKHHIITTSNANLVNASYDNLVKYSEKYGKPYIKVKLDTSYPDNQILTEVWHSGDGIKAQCQFDNIDDFALCVPFKSDIRMIVKVVKLWVVNKTYGLTIQLKKLEVKPLVQSSYQIDFIDDD